MGAQFKMRLLVGVLALGPLRAQAAYRFGISARRYAYYLGFGLPAARAGNGLANLRARAIGGRVQLTSALGVGASVTRTAPIS